MIHVAREFGVSGRGLAKTCERLKVPCPPRGYWAKKSAGKKVVQLRLQPPPPGTPSKAKISSTPAVAPPSPLAPEVESLVEAARAAVVAVVVSERLTRPHPIIAGWLADRERRRMEARRESEPSRRRAFDPGEFTPAEKRQHRILDALFKALEAQGGKVRLGDRSQLTAEFSGEKIEFDIRKKQKQVRRPLTAEEKRQPYNRDKEWMRQLETTDLLIFHIRTYLPGGLKSEWRKSEEKPIKSLLPEIAASFVAAGPLLVRQRKEREEAERQRHIAEMKRYEENRLRQCDDNRWRMFGRLAAQARDVELARAFLMALKAKQIDAAEMIGDKTVGDWIAWAEGRLEAADPLLRDACDVFENVAAVNAWNFRSEG